MPVRSLNSPVLKWPDAETVHRAVEVWATRETKRHKELRQLGFFGSYARGDWGVGSDLDIIAVVVHASEPFERRPLSWDLTGLPVPAEILVYTVSEWERLQSRGDRFARMLEREVKWIYSKE